MPERETIAATLAAALLQSMPSPPGQPVDVTVVCRHAVSLYETILGMLPAKGSPTPR